MVLLHGFSNCWRAWTPVLPALEARHSIFAPTAAWHHGGPPLQTEEGTDFLEMVEWDSAVRLAILTALTERIRKTDPGDILD